MVLVTIWGIGGLFLDGWAHSNVPQLETFFTPWHAVLYSGYLAVAATLVIKTISNLKKASSGERASGATLSLVRRIPNRAPGVTFLEAVPAGYGLSLLHTGVLMSFVLLALRRWRLPLGVFTLIFTLNTGLMAVFNPEVVVWLLPSVYADLLYRICVPLCQSLAGVPR